MVRTSGTASARKASGTFQKRDSPELLSRPSPAIPFLSRPLPPTLLKSLTDAMRTTKKLRETSKRDRPSATPVAWNHRLGIVNNHACQSARTSTSLVRESGTTLSPIRTWLLIVNAIQSQAATEEELTLPATATALLHVLRLTSIETMTTTLMTPTETLRIRFPDRLRRPSAISSLKL